jgi:Cu/Ag efflux pump CusA
VTVRAPLTRILATLALSVGIVYGILAILYRSYSLPLVIMLTVPLAAIGAFGALYITKQPLNLDSMLGIVMLVGIVAKKASSWSSTPNAKSAPASPHWKQCATPRAYDSAQSS